MKINKETLIKLLKGRKCSRKILTAVSKLPDRGFYGLNDILNQLKGV